MKYRALFYNKESFTSRYYDFEVPDRCDGQSTDGDALMIAIQKANENPVLTLKYLCQLNKTDHGYVLGAGTMVNYAQE